MNKQIGDMTNDELIDFIIELQEENSRYERIIKLNKYKKRILELEEATNFLLKENERIEKEYKNKVDEIGKLTSKIYKVIKYK